MLQRIPERLHSNGRPDINQFEVGELLYRRCSPEEQIDPFATISLTDISVNREGLTDNRPLCEPEDVLRDYSSTAENEWLSEQVCVPMIIKQVNAQGTYTCYDNVDDPKCNMQLVHDQIPCNYAHCAFKIWVDGEEVSFLNYKNTLKKNAYREFRTKCRFELGRMIIKGKVYLPPGQAKGESPIDSNNDTLPDERLAA